MKKLLLTMATVIGCMVASTVMVNAAKVEGWQQVGSNWQYVINGAKVTNNWVCDASGLWYFFDEDGNMVTDSFINQDDLEAEDEPIYYNDTYYYVGSNGAMCTGWNKIATDDVVQSPLFEASDEGWYYFGTNGKLVRDTWVQEPDGLWYALGIKGEMFTNSIVYENIRLETGDKFYVNSNGAMLTGWYQTTENDEIAEEGSWLYFNENGSIVEQGWKKIDGEWYWFGTAEKVRPINKDKEISNDVVTGGAIYVVLTNVLMDDDGHTVYLGKDGALKTGLHSFKDGNSTYSYYFAENGPLVKASAELTDTQYMVVKADGDYIAIDKNGYVKVAGYAYTSVVDSEVFEIVADKSAIPVGSYYYRLGTGNALKEMK